MAAVSSSEVSQLSEGNAKFTNALYNLLRQTPGNIFYSPISIEAVLALAYAGASGNTAAEIQKAVALPESRDATSEAFGKLMDQLTSNKDVTLNIANSLYADKQFNIKPEYLALVQQGFKSELGQVNFADGEAAAKEINAWVSKKTNGKIPELFDAGSLTAATKVVLLNAIYFKGNWLHKFPAHATKKAPFHLNEKETKEIDFMVLKEKFRINEDDDSYVLELPYQGEDVSMVLVVPKSITGLAAIEQKVLDSDLNQMLKDGRKREIILTMPKFKLEKTIELNDILVKLGMKDLFDERRADLTGISDVPLFVSKAIQKSFIEVNEEGSEAAAATGLMMVTLMARPSPSHVLADRPFLFYLKHNPTATTLFVGRLAQPVAEA